MKKTTLPRLVILVSTGIFLFAMSSCSTSKMALNLHRNHIILVKAPPTNNTDPQKEIASTATASTDVTLLALPEKNITTGLDNLSDLQIRKHAPAIPAEDFTSAKASSTKTSEMPLLSYDAKTKAIIKTIQFVEKISGKKRANVDSGAMAMDSHNLLILWIACLLGAVLFSVLGFATGGFFWIIAYLLDIAALVFFILWILSIANG